MRQRSIAELLASDACPVSDWSGRLERLVPAVYPYDAALARELEVGRSALLRIAACAHLLRRDAAVEGGQRSSPTSAIT